jgi:hypothetical protein
MEGRIDAVISKVAQMCIAVSIGNKPETARRNVIYTVK